ncbi:MAG: hypothetical protein ABIO02_04015, partial [Patescibacteria group bacterium]
DPNIERMIKLYPNWHLEAFNSIQLGELTWYFEEDNPSHISHYLTDKGRHRKVKDVAKKYLNGGSTLIYQWNNTDKIESICEELGKNKSLEPIIVVPGDRYPNSPDSSFIDGVHRSLAAMIYSLRTGDDIKMEAFVGKKEKIINRVFNRMR